MEHQRPDAATWGDTAEIADSVARVVELLTRVADTLARIEDRQERTNQLLAEINRSI